jgi:hypothetical protein
MSFSRWHFFLLGGLGALTSYGQSAEAQTAQQTNERIGTARVEVLEPDKCSPRLDMGGSSQESLGFGATAAALVAQSVFSAGATALAGALEAASRGATIGGEGISSTALVEYELSPPTLVAAAPVAATATTPPTNSAFVRATSMQPNEISKCFRMSYGGFGSIVQLQDREGHKTVPDLVIELQVYPVRGGFAAQPVFVRYNRPLAGLNWTTNYPLELHLALATPSNVANSNIGSVFAAFRLRFPQLRCGEGQAASARCGSRGDHYQLDKADLAGVGPIVFPSPPREGLDIFSGGTIATRVNTAADTVMATQTAWTEAVVADAEKSTDATVAAKSQARRIYRLAVTEYTAARQAYEVFSSDSSTVMWPPVNVQMRAVFIRDSNRFGLAFAEALRGNATTIGTNL